jgi:multicomponent Na+:H+ antiporter subunit D
MDNSIPLFVAIPLGMGFLTVMLGKRIRWIPDLIGNGTLAVLLVMSFTTIGKEQLYHMGSWATPLGIDLRLDGLSSLLLIAINVIGFAVTLFSIQYMRMYTSKVHYYGLFLFMVGGMNGVCLTGDLFNLFVFMEIAAIASYALVGFGCEHEELEASFKYIVLGSIASALILVAIALIYALTGTLNMAQMAEKISAISSIPRALLLSITLLICGFGLKAALVPFHAWLPDAHPSAPAPVSAMLSGVVIKALGIYVIARLVFNVFNAAPQLLEIVRLLGAISMVAGVLLAIGQWDMKRLFAYHSISQIGYIAIGIGLGTPLGIIGGLYHLVNHSVFKSLLFLNAGAVEYATGTRDLKKLGGLNKEMPVTGTTSLIASMSIAGIPPFNGFFSKLIIVAACVLSGHFFLAAAAVFVSIMTLASFLKVQRYGFFEKAKMSIDSIRRTPIFMSLSMIFLAFLCVAMSAFIVTGLRNPWLISRATEVLLKGAFGL